MRVKNKKRFLIASTGLAALVILVIVVLTIGIWHSNEKLAEAENNKNTQTTASLKVTAAKEVKTIANTQSAVMGKPAQTIINEEIKTSNEVNTTPAINSTATDSITILVNKNHSISSTYVPDDLVTVDLPSTRNTQLRSIAAEGLTKLFAAAENAGFELYCCSGYRSYATQAELYAWNVETYGVDGAELVSARPGMSEHQLGLAMDVTSAAVGFDLLESFGSTPEGLFIKENAHKYGFIVRYPEGKTNITGYAYEPWHLRYLGVDVATEIYNSGKTMEEYFGSN